MFQQFMYDLSGTDIGCDLFGKHYTCVVPLANFYWTIVLLSCISMCVYVFCVLYNMVLYIHMCVCVCVCACTCVSVCV